MFVLGQDCFFLFSILSTMPSFSFLLCAFFFVCELVAKWLPEWAPLVLFQFVSPYYMQNHLFLFATEM